MEGTRRFAPALSNLLMRSERVYLGEGNLFILASDKIKNMRGFA